jgi:hypothetical protein
VSAWFRWLWQFICDFLTWRGASLQVGLPDLRTGGTNVPNKQWPELAQEGITIGMKDKGGNVIDPASFPDPTTISMSYDCSDPSVVVMAQPPAASPYATTGKSTGKAGTGLTISATLTFLSGGAAPITGVSAPFDVPAGAPAEVDVNIGI